MFWNTQDLWSKLIYRTMPPVVENDLEYIISLHFFLKFWFWQYQNKNFRINSFKRPGKNWAEVKEFLNHLDDMIIDGCGINIS